MPIIADTECPKCAEEGRDKSGNHLMVFDDGGTYCNRCGYKEVAGTRDEDGDVIGQPKPKRGKKRKITNTSWIEELKCEKLAARGISRSTALHFGVKVEYNTSTREEYAYYYPLTEKGKTVAYHVRKLPKDFSRVGQPTKNRKIDLFGQSVCRKGGKRLLIVEGQDDAMAAYEMMYRKYPKSKPSVVGCLGDSAKMVSDNLDFVLNFEEVVICTDMDDAGRKAAHKLAKLVGGRARVMTYSEKDPNDMLKKHKEEEFVDSFFAATPYLPEGILTVDDVYEDALKRAEWGRHWPWPSLDALTYGRRDGEGIFVGAAVKAGKTEWLNQMVQYIIQEEGLPAFMVKFEQEPSQTVQSIAGKIAHKQFHKPDGDFTDEELKAAVDQTKGKLLMFDASFSDVGQSNMWDRLKQAIRHAVLVEGCRDVFIDPITQLTDGMTPSETETELRRFSNELAGMAKDLGFFYYCFCHLKAPETGKTHEEGGPVKVAQFRGSRAMAEKTKYMLGIIRNQYAEDPVERNTSRFHLLLNSGFGKTGMFDVVYDDETGDYLEPRREVKPNVEEDDF